VCTVVAKGQAVNANITMKCQLARGAPSDGSRRKHRTHPLWQDLTLGTGSLTRFAYATLPPSPQREAAVGEIFVQSTTSVGSTRKRAIIRLART